MNIFERTKKLVQEEKVLTAKILENLKIIEERKLYCDLGYSSMYKYLIKELNYSEGEASLRIAAVKLMISQTPKIESVMKDKLGKGELNLTQMGLLHSALTSAACTSEDKVLTLLDRVSKQSTRETEKTLDKELNLNKPKFKNVGLNERILAKMERLKEIYGERSEAELIEILLDEKLRAVEVKNNVETKEKNSRYIPVKVKAYVQKRADHCCEYVSSQGRRCDERRNLQYEHTVPFAQKGSNSIRNIKLFCANHNQRERIKIFGVANFKSGAFT